MKKYSVVIVCTQCNRSLTPDNFHNNKSRALKVNSICKICANAAAKHRYHNKKMINISTTVPLERLS